MIQKIADNVDDIIADWRTVKSSCEIVMDDFEMLVVSLFMTYHPIAMLLILIKAATGKL